METRQLAYFVLACQCRSHAEAAVQAGVSASTLSESLHHLEQELGLLLFQRGPVGHFPTEVARWLFQQVEPVLQLVEAAETALQTEEANEYVRLDVTSPLQFMLGPLSRAANLAVRALREDYPDVIAQVRFLDGQLNEENVGEIGGIEAGNSNVPSVGAQQVVLDYAAKGDIPRQTFLFNDRWIGVTNVVGSPKPGKIVDIETLRSLPLLMPHLLPAQARHVRDYCVQHNLPDPIVIDEDVGTFLRLSRASRSFILLAPQSFVAGALLHLNLDYVLLPRELVGPVVGRVSNGGAIADAYIRLLREVIADADPLVTYQPRITLRQMRYFLALRDKLNMTTAARHLHVAQPTLSNQLRKLECIVGKPLFRRQTTGLQSTPETERLAQLVADAVKRCDSVVFRARHIAADQRHRLSIGIFPILNHDGPLAEALSGALEEWTQTFPNVKLQVLEAPAAKLHRWVEAGLISFGLVEAHVSRSSQLDLQSRDNLGAVSAARSGLLSAGEVSLKTVADLPLVLPSQEFGLRQLLDRAAERIEVRLAPRLEVNSLTMILAMVRRMRLATIMPAASVQPFVSSGAFQFNPISDPPIVRRLSIVYSPSRSLTEIERALVEIIGERLRVVGFNALAATNDKSDGASKNQAAFS